MALKVSGDRVVIRVDEPETTEGGIHLPESAQEKPQQGTVMEVGEGKRLDDGTLVCPDVEKGDKVIFAKYGGTEITDEDEEYLILDNSQIYAKLE